MGLGAVFFWTASLQHFWGKGRRSINSTVLPHQRLLKVGTDPRCAFFVLSAVWPRRLSSAAAGNAVARQANALPVTNVATLSIDETPPPACLQPLFCVSSSQGLSYWQQCFNMLARS